LQLRHSYSYTGNAEPPSDSVLDLV
jgi:hypothetical protein